MRTVHTLALSRLSLPCHVHISDERAWPIVLAVGSNTACEIVTRHGEGGVVLVEGALRTAAGDYLRAAALIAAGPAEDQIGGVRAVAAALRRRDSDADNALVLRREAQAIRALCRRLYARARIEVQVGGKYGEE